MAIHIRDAIPADADPCGRIIYDAFRGIASRHGFTPDFPTIEAAAGLAHSFIADRSVFGVVAEADGRVVGSNFLSEGDAIRGVGPITVDPGAQGDGVGRRLMEAVLDRAGEADGVRLLQDSFNMASMSLYASLGFKVREPMLVMSGRPRRRCEAIPDVRPMTEQDLDACNSLSIRIHGFARANDLSDGLKHHAPLVRERGNRVTGYLTAPTFWIANHGVAESADDMKALILGAAAATTEPLSFLLPSRQANILRWCLDAGFRAAKPMTLMSVGRYRSPRGYTMPSVFY